MKCRIRSRIQEDQQPWMSQALLMLKLVGAGVILMCRWITYWSMIHNIMQRIWEQRIEVYLCWKIWMNCWMLTTEYPSNADNQIQFSRQHSILLLTFEVIAEDGTESRILTVKLNVTASIQTNKDHTESNMLTIMHWILTTKIFDHHHNMMTVGVWHKLRSIDNLSTRGWFATCIRVHTRVHKKEEIRIGLKTGHNYQTSLCIAIMITLLLDIIAS